MALLVNLYGGPGSGKSTMMASIFAELKCRHVKCEMATEFAKEKLWEKSLGVFENQIYMFGKQMHAIHRVVDKVDVVITDSPILLSRIYAPYETKTFHDFVTEVSKRYNNFNVFLQRSSAEYDPEGRFQTEDEAIEKDVEIKNLLESIGEPYTIFPADRSTAPMLVDEIVNKLQNEKQ